MRPGPGCPSGIHAAQLAACVRACPAGVGGVPITGVAKWRGHRNINVAYAIYGHLVLSSLGRALDVLNAWSSVIHSGQEFTLTGSGHWRVAQDVRGHTCRAGCWTCSWSRFQASSAPGRRTLAGMRLPGLFRNAYRADFSSMDNAKHNDQLGRLWIWAMHEDDNLNTGASLFLLAQSILIAVTASLVNTFAGLHPAQDIVRAEVFGLAMALDLAGLALTLIFWYTITISLRGSWVLIERLKELDEELYADLARRREEDRSQLWFHRAVSRHMRGDDAIYHLLPLTVLIIWCIVAAFAIAIFASH